MLTEGDITLRKLSLKDKASLALLANNKKIWNNVRDYMPSPYSEKDAEDFINTVQDENPVTTFTIDYKGQFCGVIGLVKQQDVYRLTAEIGYWIGEPFWNKGIATTAVKLITAYGLYQLNFERLQTGIFEHNTSSMKV